MCIAISALWGGWTYCLLKAPQPSSSNEQHPTCSGYQTSRNSGRFVKAHKFCLGKISGRKKSWNICKATWLGHLRLARLSLPLCPCFLSTAQPLSAATWPTCHSTLLQSHQPSGTTCLGTPYTSKAIKLCCYSGTPLLKVSYTIPSCTLPLSFNSFHIRACT